MYCYLVSSICSFGDLRGRVALQDVLHLQGLGLPLREVAELGLEHYYHYSH